MNETTAKKKPSIRSMTGYGKGKSKSAYGEISVEVKSLNHKGISVSCTPFDGIFLLEEKIKDLVENKVLRGKVFVKITRSTKDSKKSTRTLQVNEELLKEYVDKTNKIKKKYPVTGELTVKDIVMIPGILEQSNDSVEEKTWPDIKKALTQAIDGLMIFREREGAKLSKDFLMRIKKMSTSLKKIQIHQKQGIEQYKERLTELMKKATNEKTVNNNKIAEETALFARNCDIEEEIVRLSNHIELYEKTLRGAEKEIGKKLDFIAQEMHRETNTIGSKAGYFKISNEVIEIKSEIDKIREQLSNIE
ncbi:MAG: YicC family protein [Candidatus Omnitrophica bacterium]|nr:YicC family protein [Candidatus Omnitrophota bacterium]